jgi:hypothetical protein
MNTIRRGLAGVAFLSVAQAAFAVHPTIQHIPFNDTATDSRCGFAVTVQQSGIIVDISYTDSQGALHDFQAAPQTKAMMTNVATGKTITFSTSGPGRFTFNPDGSLELVGTGNWIWGHDPDINQSVEGSGWFHTTGRFIVFIDVNGVETNTLMGTSTNLCDELAG